MKRYSVILVFVLALILSSCKIDEVYSASAPISEVYYAASATPEPTATHPPRPTTDPHMYPTIAANQLPMLGEFVPNQPVHVFADISLTEEVGILEPGVPAQFTSYVNLQGVITYLCVDWTTAEDATGYRWDCTGWVLASADGYLYGSTIYYYGIVPFMAPTVTPDPQRGGA